MNLAAFLADVAAQNERYRAMAALAEESISLLASRPLDAALPLLERKQALLAEISEIDARLAPIRSDWERIRASLSEADRSRVEEAVRGTRDVLEGLVALENRAKEAMERKHVASIRDFQDRVARSRLRDAYGGGAP